MDEHFSNGSPEAAAVVSSTEPTTQTTAPAAEVAAAPVSIRDSLQNAVAQQKADVPNADHPGADGKTAAERARDDKGRFAKGGTADPAAPKPETTQDPTKVVPDPNQAAPIGEGPRSWSAAEREAVFKKLPPEAQQIIVRRETELLRDHTQKTMQASAVMRRYQPLDAIIGPREEKWRLDDGSTPDQVIGQLVAAQERLDRDPLKGIAFIMDSYQISPQQMHDYLRGGGQQQMHESALQRRIDELEARVNEAPRQQFQQHLQTLEQQTKQYAEAVGQDGRPLRPHFNQLSHLIAPIVSQLRAQKPHESFEAILEQAYEQAAWANPEARAARIEEQRKADETKRIEEQKKRADEARGKAVSINGTPGGPLNGVHQGKSVRSMLLQSIKQQQEII